MRMIGGILGQPGFAQIECIGPKVLYCVDFEQSNLANDEVDFEVVSGAAIPECPDAGHVVAVKDDAAVRENGEPEGD